MKQILAKLDGTNVQIALKTCLALVLDLAIALPLDWKPSFGAILIVVLQTPMLGATYKKGLLYIAGTLSGAITGLAMVGLCAHDRRVFLLAMAVLIGFGIYRLQGSRYPYAWLIFTITSALVGFFSAQNASSAFGIAVMRASTICLAVVVSFFVNGILWPVRAGNLFERQLLDLLNRCRGMLSRARRALASGEADPDAEREAETAQIKAFAALDSTLDAAASEGQRYRRFRGGYQQLVDELYDLLLAIVAVRESMRTCHDGGARELPIADSDNIRNALQMAEDKTIELARDLKLPRDGTMKPRESAIPDRLDAEKPDTTDSAFAAMLAEQVHGLARQVAEVRATVARVEDPNRDPPPLPARAREPFRLTSLRFRKAAVGSLVILLLGWLFIITQWPMGLQLSMVFATIAIVIGSMVPLVAIGRQLLGSLVLGAAIAAPLYLGIMPRISQYEQLIPWLCIALFPLFLAMTGSSPQRTFQTMFAAIFVIALLSLDEERQSYSFSSFVNMWIGLCGGFAAPLAVFGLFSSVVPEREFWQRVRSFFAACAESMKNLDKATPYAPAEAAVLKTARKQRLGLIKQMQMWSTQIDYRRVAGNDQRKGNALIDSIGHVALRLDCVGYACRKPGSTVLEPLREPFDCLYESCVRSFQLIANSLANRKPVPELPDTETLVCEIESDCNDIRRSAVGNEDVTASVLHVMSVTAQLHSLDRSLHDCCDRVNALDWEAWSHSCF